MTKQKSTKKTLLTSVLSLVLCMAMLIGTTFAWFTDSVTSAGNKIQAGTLKIDLELLDKETKAWNSIKDSQDPIFNYNLWEPGYTDVKVLKVENEGTLALKWIAKFVTEQKPLSILANVIDVYVCSSATELAYPADRDLTGYTRVGTVADFVDTIEETTWGNLKAGEEAYLGIALKMQETAGNEYQGLELGAFDIQILATQLTYETDSFDNQYDAGLKPLEEGEVLIEENGIQYVYTPDGDLILYLVTEQYTNDTVVVPEGVKTIGNYAFAYNSNVKEVVLSSTVRNLGRGFDSSTVEKVVLNEGLEQIDSRAFRATTNLKEVVISSTVKTIADNAFQKSGLKEITIPATVETIGETAFGSSLIETVTFEGNTSIQGYAFRGCTKLRTVYMKGDDVTFIPSTLNNRNSMWFCNGESNNPNTSNITFYVENETVATRVKTAMGAEAGNTPVYIDGDVFVNVKNATELQNALNNATQDTIIYFTADITGDATVTQKENIDIVINGNEKKFIGIMTTFGNGRQNGAETLTIKNVNFVAANGADSCVVSPDRAKNNKYSYAHNVTVDNCTFTDADGAVNCAAIRHEDGGDKNWVVKDCTVDDTMHSLLQVNNVAGKLTVDGCTANSKNGINLNSCTNVEIIDYTANVKGYAVRFGVNTGGNLNEAKNFLIKDSNLKSANDDGDAVIIFRADAVKAVLTLENTSLVGNPQISGNTSDTTINQY